MKPNHILLTETCGELVLVNTDDLFMARRQEQNETTLFLHACGARTDSWHLRVKETPQRIYEEIQQSYVHS